MWALLSDKVKRKILGTLSVRQLAKFSLVFRMYRADFVCDVVSHITSDFFFDLKTSQTLETEQSLRMATEFLRNSLFRTSAPDLFKLYKLELGFGLRSTSWTMESIENILEPLTIVSVSHLSTVKIFWDALSTPTLETFVKSLKYCKNLQEFSLFEANISKPLMDAVLGLCSKRITTLAFPRCTMSPADFDSESALRAIEALIRKYSNKIERLSIPGYGRCRFNFALILREIALPNLISIDLPNYCCEHPIFAHTAKYSDDPKPFMEILPTIRKTYNLPNLVSFTVYSKCLIAETVRHTPSLSTLYNFLTHTPLSFHSLRHEWLLSESSRDVLLPLLSMMHHKLGSSDKAVIKYILDSWNSICRGPRGYSEISREIVVEEFITGICSFTDPMFQWVVDHIAHDKQLIQALLPRGPTALLRLVSPAYPVAERIRRLKLANFIARHPDLSYRLGYDWSATDASGNTILHLIEDKSVNLAICAIEVGEVDYSVRNSSGDLAYDAILLYSLYSGDHAGIYLVLADNNQGILLYWSDLMNLYSRLPSHVRDLHFDLTDLVNMALEVLEDLMDEFPSTVYSEYRRIRRDAEPSLISQQFKKFIKHWETLMIEPLSTSDIDMDIDATMDDDFSNDDDDDEDGVEDEDVEVEDVDGDNSAEAILSEMRKSKYPLSLIPATKTLAAANQ